MTVRTALAPRKFSVKEICQRSLATFIAAAATSPIGAAVFDVATWKAALYGGVIAVVNLAGRLAQRFLAENPE